MPAYAVRSPSNMPADTTSSRASTFEGTEPDKDFYYAVKPNQMTYTDDAGVSRSIYIPRGKNEEAYRHFEHEDWKSLSLFPIWTGAPEQQYDDKDFIKMPKEQAKTD